jgi:hypothetical protein
MKISPHRWMDRPTIRIEVEKDDWPKLKNKKPSPMDWLGRTVAKARTDKWTCNAANVINNTIVYVPRFAGFTPPTGAALEKSLTSLMHRVEDILAEEKLIAPRRQS